MLPDLPSTIGSFFSHYYFSPLIMTKEDIKDVEMKDAENKDEVLEGTKKDVDSLVLEGAQSFIYRLRKF